MEKPLETAWVGLKLGGVEPQRINRVGQTVWARLMEFQIWLPLAGSVALSFCGGRAHKKTMASASTSACEKSAPQLLPWCWSIQFLPVCLQCWSSEGVSPVNRYVGPLRGTAWESNSYCFLSFNVHCFSQPEVMRNYLPGTGTLGCGVWCGVGTPCFNISLPICMCHSGNRTRPFHVSAPLTSLDVVFNSVVVELSFSSIFGSSE